MRTLTKRDVGRTPALLWATAEIAAEEGEDVIIPNIRGKGVYRVQYLADQTDFLADLQQAGIYTPPTCEDIAPPTVDGHYTRAATAAILDDLRGRQ